ncbi:cryptochrome DASH-like protein [Lates japonicus]|uniref:Cryptochrome DASH n=1 Tax=Lates japonicus TaxID=270547 RepID=A0AAD3R3L1_LATJO|nr:cryptochrome DASH-like protein [Lates japonicus]
MSTSRTVICLLRNDLRLHDNELFHWAQRNAEYIVPLYCFDPRHYVGTYNYNLPKTGPFRLRFLLESIRDLRSTLLNKGSNLVVRRGKPEDVVAELIKQLGSVSTVAFHEEVTSEELNMEKKALARLKHYFWDSDAVATYKETRNGLIGVDYSTKFAPWLAMGCISPRYIYHQNKQYERERTANQSTYWVIFELLWRDYFKFVGAKYGNRLFQLEGLQNKSVPWKKDMKLFNAWKEGQTGVPFVDANMRELALTGFMSNRGRQNVASFLTKDLGLDWRMGAEWFEYLLIDHDVCSNYGNWLYSAGIGNDPRENRKFNMIKQGLDYDNNGDYVRQWVPELKEIRGSDVHTPWTLSSAALSHAHVSLGETYPSPVVIAPEWSRHVNKKPSGTGPSPRGKKGPSHTPKQHRDRGIDFYFSRSKNL